MEFIEENVEHKKHHYFGKTITVMLLFFALSFVCAYFGEGFAPVADAFTDKIFEAAGKETSCTFFSDYTRFAKETVSSVIYFVEAVKESFSEKQGAEKTVSPVLFTCMATSPVKSETVTSDFGSRTNPISNKKETHTGIDIAAGYGAAIMAAWPGEIYETGEDEIYGKYIIIRHSKDFFTKYCHLSEISVKEKDFVLAGEEIGKAGDSGWATGSHLHFEVIVEGIYIDPRECLEIC